MITCRDFAEFVWAYLTDELPSPQRFEFDAHLAVCPHCVVYLDTYRKTVEMGKDAFSDPDSPVPSDLPEELVDAILAAREAEE
jgi:anti-sigma factor RsiW